MEGSGLTERLVVFPEVLQGPGLQGAREGRRRTLGYSEHTQRPQAPQKALGRLWGCTHSHMKGGVGKAKCHLSTTPERAPRGLCWEDLELSTRQAESPGAQPQPLPCPGDSWEHREQGCGHGALALTSREIRMCPGGQAAASVALLAIPRFGSVSPWFRRAELQAQAGEIPAAPSFQRLFSCPACGSSALVLVGGPFRVFGFSSLLQPKQCVLCQLPSCGVTGSVRSSQTDANPPSSTERSKAASRQPFPQVFPSG